MPSVDARGRRRCESRAPRRSCRDAAVAGTTVPAVIGVPSPQSMVAVKSAIDESRWGRIVVVNSATGPFNSGAREHRERVDGRLRSVLTVGWVAPVTSAGRRR